MKTTYFIIGQALSILCIIFNALSFQFKTHRKILICKSTGEFFAAIHYFFLYAYTGMALACVSVVRNLTFSEVVRRKIKTLFFQIFFSLIYIVFGIFSWEGYLSLLYIVAKIISCISYGLSNENQMRFLNCFAVGLCLIYNFIHLSIGGTISDLLTEISLIIALIRFSKVKRQKTN